jgi:exonuclease VII large subunit
MTPTNELDALLMESLQQLSEEFQQREARLTRLYNECVTSFEQQSKALSDRQAALMQRSSVLTEQYEVVMRQLALLSEALAKFPRTPGR